METIRTVFTLTVLCVTLICSPQSFSQNFVDGQMPDTFLKHRASVSDIKFSPDGTTITSGGGEDIILCDVATGTLKTTLEGHTDWVNSVAFSPDGTTIASGGGEDIILCDVATGTLKTTLEGHTDWVNSVAFSPNGKLLASGSMDETVKLWDVATGTLKTTLGGHTDWVNSVAFSPNGKLLASGSEADLFKHRYGTVKLWDVATGTLKTTLEGRTIDSVAFSPDGTTLASGGSDEAVRLWDVASGKLKAKLEGHTASVNSVAFSPDGTTIASGSSDNTVKLWDVTRQPKAPKATLSDHSDSVYSVIFSPDGTVLASGSEDGSIRLWTALPPVNGDGVVNVADLVEVAQNFGQVGKNNADVNGDGIVNIVDLILVAVALGEVAGAPAAHTEAFSMLPAEEVRQWLIEAKQLQIEEPTYLRGILFLEQLLALLVPKETVLLANYPNPFNPETWISYQLATSADVLLTIYDINGHVVRALDLGYQRAGVYQSRSRAAYWDGRNIQGEPVASGVYFYTLSAGDFTATRKMLIRK